MTICFYIYIWYVIFALGCETYILSESMLTTLSRDMTVHLPAASHLREMKLVQWSTCSPGRDLASTVATTMTITTLMSPSSRVCLRPRRVQLGSHRPMRLSRRHSGFGLPCPSMCQPFPVPWNQQGDGVLRTAVGVSHLARQIVSVPRFRKPGCKPGCAFEVDCQLVDVRRPLGRACVWGAPYSLGPRCPLLAVSSPERPDAVGLT